MSRLIAEIRLLELVQHPAQFDQHAPHQVLLRLVAQTFTDDLVQCLSSLRQEFQRLALKQIRHSAMPTRFAEGDDLNVEP